MLTLGLSVLAPYVYAELHAGQEIGEGGFDMCADFQWDKNLQRGFGVWGQPYTGLRRCDWEGGDSQENVMLEENYLEGMRHGKHAKWSEEGDLVFSATYKKNILHGPYEGPLYFRYNQYTSYYAMRKNHRTGETVQSGCMFKGTYVNGKKEGVWEGNCGKGNSRKVVYKNDIRVKYLTEEEKQKEKQEDKKE